MFFLQGNQPVVSWFDVGILLQLFALINPLSSLPFMINAHRQGVDVRRLSLSAVFTAYIIAIFIALVGPFLFNIFGITVDSFRIAGGIVLLLLALDTIRGQEEKDNKPTGNLDSLIAILATPLLTGPATISFISIKSYEIPLMILLLDVSLAFIFVGIVFVIICFSIPKINMKLVEIVSKILGLFLMAMAIEMIAFGISNFVKTAMVVK